MAKLAAATPFQDSGSVLYGNLAVSLVDTAWEPPLLLTPPPDPACGACTQLTNLARIIPHGVMIIPC
jgi:stage III sporulation protein SpoIIIAA